MRCFATKKSGDQCTNTAIVFPIVSRKLGVCGMHAKTKKLPEEVKEVLCLLQGALGNDPAGVVVDFLLDPSWDSADVFCVDVLSVFVYKTRDCVTKRVVKEMLECWDTGFPHTCVILEKKDKYVRVYLKMCSLFCAPALIGVLVRDVVIRFLLNKNAFVHISFVEIEFGVFKRFLSENAPGVAQVIHEEIACNVRSVMFFRNKKTFKRITNSLAKFSAGVS